MRRFFYHTDLVQNAVFHNFSRQIAFIQYSGPSKNAWTFNQRNRSKNVQNHLYSMWSLVCVFSENDKIFRQEKKYVE